MKELFTGIYMGGYMAHKGEGWMEEGKRYDATFTPRLLFLAELSLWWKELRRFLHLLSVWSIPEIKLSHLSMGEPSWTNYQATRKQWRETQCLGCLCWGSENQAKQEQKFENFDLRICFTEGVLSEEAYGIRMGEVVEQGKSLSMFIDLANV